MHSPTNGLNELFCRLLVTLNTMDYSPYQRIKPSMYSMAPITLW